MESKLGPKSYEKESHTGTTHDTIHPETSTMLEKFVSVDIPSREGTPWPENENKPDEDKNTEKKIIEDGMSGGDENIMIPVESTKISSIPELGTPGSSTRPEGPATLHPPDDNSNISTIEHTCSEEKRSHDVPPPPCSSNDTHGLPSSSLVCTTITTTKSPDRNPPSPFALHSKLLLLQDKKMVNKDMTTPKRKRKSPSVGLQNQKPKKPKIMAEPRKTPACKSCYHKHIGCDRQTENEPCRACERRKQPCERNDVRVVKGEKTVVKEEPTISEPSHVAEETPQDEPIEGGVVTPSSFRALSVTETDGEDQYSCGQEVEGDAATSVVPGQDQDQEGDHQEEAPISRTEIEEEGEVADNGYAGMTDAEKEAVEILMGMKGATVDILNQQTSDRYFEAIKEILIEEVEDHKKRRVGLKMLEKLKWQMTWLGGMATTMAPPGHSM
ncbi:hypothetical protein TWF506_011175 [Arthrobotrys conoides]|uniref:Zn(2)-C6 fungal-type domain-containing protein n=1 Tax=Arthrobotrys conoides TaxID=74498 RepID=A0AAN8NQ84_9PEZI